MAWVELLQSHSGSRDSSARGQVQRQFRVWGGVSVAMILETPHKVDDGNGSFLPAVGSAHPDYIDHSMVLESYSCVPDSISIIATAYYTNSPLDGSLTNPDKRIGTSFERRNVELWYGYTNELLVKPPLLPEKRWTLTPKTFIENFMRLTYRVIVPKKDPFKKKPYKMGGVDPGPFVNGWDGNAMELIRAAIGEIHYFGFDGAPAAQWQFSGADPSDRNLEDAVTVVYQWVRDPGTPVFQMEHPVKDPNDLFFIPKPEHPGRDGKKYVRAPFAKVIPTIDTKSPGNDDEGNQLPPTYEPLFFMLYTERINDDGWKSLPGLLP